MNSAVVSREILF